MAETSRSAEIETNCDVTIAIQSDRTSKEQKILRVPCQLIEGIEEVSQLAKTETNCHVSIAIQKDRTSIGQKLPALPLPLPWTMPAQKILRVPHQLLEVNEKAYEPYVISIGPYHCGKDHLKEMEGHKVRSLNRLLQRTNKTVEIFLSEIEEIAEKARNCYSEPLDISKEEFVEMMVLDGCFIILFFIKELEDSFYYKGLINTSILHDLVLVENQLPFFVLWKLLGIIFSISFPMFVNMVGVPDPKGVFIHWILEKFKHAMPGLRVDPTYDENSINGVKHLVHLLHSNWRPSQKAMGKYNNMRPEDGEWDFIRCATELSEAGIEFSKVEGKGNVKRSLFDIKFKNGTLKMPTVTIDDGTESLYRNLIAWEQFDDKCPAFLTQYVLLMDCLINSRKDVELLCKRKIIVNCLGNDKSVAVLLNRLGNHTTLPKKFFYAQLFKDVNNHYEKPWNEWKANLKHKYFNTPWALISFLAATLLLLLTVLQTIFTIFLPSENLKR